MANEPQNPQESPLSLTADEIALGRVLNHDEPFAKRTHAATRIKELNLGDGWEVVPFTTGFAIERKPKDIEDAPEAAEQLAALPPQPVAPTAEPYKWVRFHSMANPDDPKDVILACNGEVLQIRRNETIPLPQRFLEIADHSRYLHYTQEPGKDRKADREILKYPFDTLGDSSREDFVRFKKSGTKATREHAERVGIPLEA